MLNKKNFFIILAVSTVIILLTFNWYKSNEKKAFNEAKNIAFIKSKIDYINYLKGIFKIPVISDKLCKKTDKNDVVVYTCRALSKNDFQTIQEKVFNHLVNVKSFHIYSNGKKMDFIMEIYKK